MLGLLKRLPAGRVTFAFALGLACLIAATAALIMSPAVMSVLVLPPLLAATACPPGRTAIVAVLAATLAAVVGAIGGAEVGSQQHTFPFLSVLLSGGVSVVLARLRVQREVQSARLEMQYSVARTLYEEGTLQAAAPRLLASIGGTMGWSVGGLWEVRPPRVLRCLHSWYAARIDPSAFDKLSRQFVLRPGIGLAGRVWESGEPAYLLDVSQDTDSQRAPIAARAGLRGAVAFPIRTRGETVGVIEFFAREVREPDAALLDMMASLGSQVGEFIEGVNAAEALRASEARKGAMLDSALDCVVTMDADGRIVEFNPAAERTFGYAAADVLGKPLDETIVPVALRGRHRGGLARYLETGRSTVLGRRLEVSALRADGTELPVELAISRIAGQDPPVFTGYIRDISDRLRGEAERERLLALESVARTDAAQARDQLEAILRGVADGVTAQTASGELVFANDAAVAQMGFGSVDELMEAGPAERLERFEILDEFGEPFDVASLPGRRALQGHAATATVRFRLRATGEERWSVVKSTPIFDDTGRVTLAINVIEDVTEAKRNERAQAFLGEVSTILSHSLDFDGTVRQVADLAVPDLADYCIVDVAAEDGTLDRAALVHADPRGASIVDQLSEYPADPDGNVGAPRVLRTGESVLFPGVPDETLREVARDDRHLSLLRELDLRSAIVVPMIARERVIGTITLATVGSSRVYDEGDLAIAEELGWRTGIAVDNARLYGERSRVAETLQRSLLPSTLPSIPGVRTAARFRPTGEGLEVGGDFYDLFESGDGWTVAIGDVCGKGPDAAAVTALARYTLRAAAMTETTPSATLSTLNEAMLRQRADLRFCTVAYGLLAPESGGARLRLARAGHPAPLVLRRDGSVEELGAPGTLLGVVSDPDLPDESAHIRAGESVLFYTDGVTEAHGANGEFGPSDLVELLAGSAGLSADEIARRVERAALSTDSGEPRDDIAVVVLQLDG